jgi:hypothetical protein
MNVDLKKSNMDKVLNTSFLTVQMLAFMGSKGKASGLLVHVSKYPVVLLSGEIIK